MSRQTWVVAVVAIIIGIAAGRLLPWPFGEMDSSNAGVSSEAEQEVLYWVAPMDPNYRRDQPGKSPMGMDLIPVYKGEEPGRSEDDVAVRITPNIVNNLGVRTSRVERGDIAPHISTVGYIEFNESSVSHIHLRTDGWIEDLKIRSIGERVKRGDLLFRLYAPTLVNAQAELLQARQGGRESLINAAEERLHALGVDEAQIRQLKNGGGARRTIPVYAPQDGVVAQLNVGEGMYVQPAKTILSLADLSTVWVLADVFESDAHAIEPGLPASMTLPYLPGESWDGKIEYVYPTVDPKTRTLKIRLRFDNPGERLKPEMYADVTVHGRSSANVITVPRQAVIRTGQSERVIVANGDGEFRPTLVKTGIEAGDRVQILQGLSEGEQVVVSGQFLIDSESNLTGAIARLEAAAVPDNAEKEEIRGKGMVNAVMVDANKVNVTHDPIPALGWPTMTMDFAVAPTVDLSQLAESHSIEFALEKDDTGTWRIASVVSNGSGPSGQGVVNVVYPDDRKINVTHGPIADLGWPSMTMDLPLKDGVPVDRLEAGMSITFVLEKDDDGMWAIQAIEPANAGDSDQ